MGPIDFVGAVEPPDLAPLSAAYTMAGGAAVNRDSELTPGAGSASLSDHARPDRDSSVGRARPDGARCHRTASCFTAS